MRIGGIASGFDTEQMVQDLMRAESMKIDKFFRQEETLKWKREALNTTNKTLADFILKSRSDFGLSSTSSTGSIQNHTRNSFDWVKKVSSSDESVIKATATATAMEGNYRIQVEQLADVASVTSGDIRDIKIGPDNDINLLENGMFTQNKEFNITVGEGEEAKLVTIKLNKDETMADVVKQINNAVDKDDPKKSLGLRAAYDSNLGKLMINTKDQGEDQIIKIDSKPFTRKIFGEGSNVLLDGAKGSNAKINFNGDLIEQSSNNFSMFGVNYQLQSAKPGEVIQINVESDVDSIFDKIKGFVDDYNEMLDNLNGLLNQKSYRDFNPLTNDEKEVMKEKEIEMWEEKAKSGLLRNDETITRTLQTMRNGLYGDVYSDFDEEGKGIRMEGFYHLTQIGISTGNYQSGGKLEIDEEKLRKAIIENPEGVTDLLFKKSEVSVPSGNTEEARTAAANKRASSGLVERLFDDMIIGMKEVVRRSGPGENAGTFRNVQSNMLIDFVTSGSISSMDRDIMNIGKRIANEQRLLMGREDRYWRQFTAMEKALDQMNQQSVWLMSQLGQSGM